MPRADPCCVVCGAECRIVTVTGQFLRECVACGYASVTTASEDADYWRALADDSAIAANPHWNESRAEQFDSVLSALARRVSGRRLLDLGGGLGYFARRALDRGWDAYSLDPSPAVAPFARERLGAERVLQELPSGEERSFDVATAWCVIAHADDPRTIARSAARALRSGGLLWLTTPNYRFQKRYAVLRRAIGRPIDFRSEDHVGHFTTTAVGSLLADATFVDVTFEHHGIARECLATSRRAPLLVAGKRLWNDAAFLIARRGGPNFMSELQISARM